LYDKSQQNSKLITKFNILGDIIANMKAFRYIIIIYIFLFMVSPVTSYIKAESNNYFQFENITTEEGLSQNYISSILQDKFGYIWFGTAAGVNQYDGINFNIYKENSSYYNSISNSSIKCLYETKDGQLWIGTSYGLNRFDYGTKTFTTFINDPNNTNSISNNNITTIFEDFKGQLWIGTSYGLNRFDYGTKTFTTFINDPNNTNSISNNNIYSICGDQYGYIWIGTNYGLNRFDYGTKTFTTFINDPNNPNSISYNHITTIFEDSKGQLWIGTSYGLNRFDYGTKTFTTFINDPNNPNSISNNHIYSICGDQYGYIWIGTNYGLNRFDIDNNVFNKYFSDGSLDSLVNNHVQYLYIDYQGILWIGTGGGISKLNLGINNFAYYSSDIGNEIYKIFCNDDQTMWIKTNLGVININVNTHQIESIYSRLFVDKNIYELGYNTFCVYENRYLFSGTINSGLEVYDIESNKLTVYTTKVDNNLLSNTITALYTDSNNTVWIGTSKGLCSFYPDNEQFTQYKDNPYYPDSVSKGEVLLIYESSDHSLWFVTDNFIYMLNNSTGKVTFINDKIDIHFDCSDILTIYKGTNDLLWIGTKRGLFCYQITSGEFISLGTEYDIADTYILSILEDGENNLWMGTLQGLLKISLIDKSYNIYKIKDGLINDSFTVASYKATSGELYFGSIGGLISFYPENIKADMNIPKVVINNFSLMDKSIIFNKPIEDIKEITLPYSDNSFEINFVALQYNEPEYNQYTYKLEGFDERWQYCDANSSFAKYTNLPAGEYTFMVKASNSDGIWNEDGASLTIIIETPYWQKWWFILLISVLALLIVIIIISLIVSLRTRVTKKYAERLHFQVEEKTQQLYKKTHQLENEITIRKKAELVSEKTYMREQALRKKVEEQVKERIEYTRALVHELKTPLTAIVASSSILVNELADGPNKSLAKHLNGGANDLNKRINELLDLAKGELGMLKLDKKRLDMFELLSDMVEINKYGALEKKQSIIIKKPQIQLPKVEIDETRIRQVVYNLLNNAIKFTPEGGNITIELEAEALSVVVNISDTGIGMSPEELKHVFQSYYKKKGDKENISGLGLGLFLSKIFIELHNGRIWVNSKKWKGSTFSFSIPASSIN
jgi:signal transduction histidine kinase/ligand-binding sensor domain-containing protein